ncbi:MAG: hypothetical protein F4W92_03660 [Gammaproteobacteria bacterium]|nr:hypothetical protein [Gammaproteobacteria bacterium]
MSHSSSTMSDRKSIVTKLLFSFVLLSFVFVEGAIGAQDAENLEEVEEKEEMTTDKSSGEEKTTSDGSEKDDESTSTASVDEEADSKTDEDSVKKEKKDSDPKVAKEKVKKKNPETGSHLPNGDPTSNVIRLTGSAMRDFYYRHEYLRW